MTPQNGLHVCKAACVSGMRKQGNHRIKLAPLGRSLESVEAVFSYKAPRSPCSITNEIDPFSAWLNPPSRKPQA